MYTLEVHLRYTEANAEWLSTWSRSNVEDEVKLVFREMKVPNLGVLGKIELKDRSILVGCRAKRRSSLYQDFSTLREALSEQRFAQILEKKGILSVQLKEKNEGQTAGDHPTKWLYAAVAQDTPVKLEPESQSAHAVATYATSASAATGASPRRFAPALPLSLSEPSLSSLSLHSVMQCDYDAPSPNTITSPSGSGTEPMIRHPVPPLPTRRRCHPPTTAVTVNPRPPLPVPPLSHPHAQDPMVCGKSNVGASNSNELQVETTITSPPYIPSSPPYQPPTPRINVVEPEKASGTRVPADLLKAGSPPIISERPSSSLGKRRAEEGPSQGYRRGGDDDAMSCDGDAERFSNSSEVEEEEQQAAFVSSWLNPQPSTFGSHPPPPSSVSCSTSTSSLSKGSSTMPTAPVPAPREGLRLTIKRPRQYANSSTEEEGEEESGKSFLESRKAKRTGPSAHPRRTNATKPYDQAGRTSKSRRSTSTQSDEENSGSSSDSSSTSSPSSASSSATSTPTSASPPRRSMKARNNNNNNNKSDSEATVVSTTSSIHNMNPALSDAELLTAWREAGGHIFESIQELIDVKKLIYHGIGERLIEERRRECGHCKNDFERDLRKLGRKLLRQEYKRLSRLL